ncbi:uncharacterized protein LOC128561967 [Nycticebus coucang]|uniref:uncharacterized protein LOC128561967 n=1 Tax=Nycticebus coucang TaxID=9470 RepID=UPI00234C3789|nr:uncharacterized protein LOC128561967 [Nycticebus coucang]
MEIYIKDKVKERTLWHIAGNLIKFPPWRAFLTHTADACILTNKSYQLPILPVSCLTGPRVREGGVGALRQFQGVRPALQLFPCGTAESRDSASALRDNRASARSAPGCGPLTDRPGGRRRGRGTEPTPRRRPGRAEGGVFPEWDCRENRGDPYSWRSESTGREEGSAGHTERAAGGRETVKGPREARRGEGERKRPGRGAPGTYGPRRERAGGEKRAAGAHGIPDSLSQEPKTFLLTRGGGAPWVDAPLAFRPATLGVRLPAGVLRHKSVQGGGRGGHPTRRKGCSLPRGSHQRTLAPGNQEAGTPGLHSQIHPQGLHACPPRL